MKNHVLMGIAVAVFGMALTATSAQALSLTPASTPQWTTDNQANLDASAVSALTGISGLTEVYKRNVDDAFDTGSSALNYNTMFANPPDDPADFTLTHVSGSSISCPTCLLLVKDGNQEPAQYVFNLGNWNGTETILGTGFWPNQGGISHIAIYTADPGVGVPEPASLLLLGAGLAGLGMWKRKASRA